MALVLRVSILMALVAGLASAARAECPEPGGAASPLSDRPYAEEPPPKPCLDSEVGRDDGPPRTARHLGIAGMGSGAAVLALGGLLWLGGALTSDAGSRRFDFDAAMIVGGLGSALFLTGTAFVLYDAVAPAPAPAPGGHGLELVLTGRF